MTLTIAQRLRAASTFFFGILLLIAVTSLWQMSRIRDETQAITGAWLPSVELVNQMNSDTGDFRVAEFRHVMNTDEAVMAGAQRRFGA